MSTSTTTAARPRRLVQRTLGALIVASLVFVVGAAPATSSPVVERVREAHLIGSWDTDIYISIQDPPLLQRMTFVFEANHMLRGYSLPGDPPLEGAGIWSTASGGTFSFWITHGGHPDENGNPVGSINAIHLGTFNRRTFTTSAFTYIDLDNGADWIGPVPVRTEGRKLPA